MNHFFQMMA